MTKQPNATSRARKPQRPGLPAKRSARTPIMLWAGALIGIAAAVLLIQSRGRSAPSEEPQAAAWRDFRVVQVYPHDPQAFVQGLIFRDGFLYESTGLNGHSSLRKVRLESGEVLQKSDVEEQHFAEGLTDFGNRLFQLTWQSNVGFVYAIDTFARQRTFTYPGEGWGLTRDRNRLIMSDGTSTLRFLDPETLQETKRLPVTGNGLSVGRLNELEMVEGEIFANVWPTDEILIIDPESGRVTGRINMSGLLPPADRSQDVDVLNGIAYDADAKRLFVTGKLWPKLFQIRLQPRP